MGLQPWEDSIEVSQPFWIMRVVAGLAMLAGPIVLRLEHLQDLAGVTDSTGNNAHRHGLRPSLSTY